MSLVTVNPSFEKMYNFISIFETLCRATFSNSALVKITLAGNCSHDGPRWILYQFLFNQNDRLSIQMFLNVFVPWVQQTINNIFQMMVGIHQTTNHYSMMTSSNGTIFRVTCHLCGEFTGLSLMFFHLHLNKWLSKQSWGWWFETLLRPLWRHCNA